MDVITYTSTVPYDALCFSLIQIGEGNMEDQESYNISKPQVRIFGPPEHDGLIKRLDKHGSLST